MDSLLYATPTGKHPHPAYVQCVRAMELSMRSFGVRRAHDFIFTCAPVHMARNKIVEHASAGACVREHDHREFEGKMCQVKPYDYLLMHDDDLQVQIHPQLGNPVDVWHEIFEKNPEVGVIGAVYLRENPMLPTVVIQHDKQPEELCHLIAHLPNHPTEVAGIGTGFMMVRRSVFDAISDMEHEAGSAPMFRFGLRRLESGMLIEEGEDYDFCRRVRAAGFKVLADPRFASVHFKDTGPLVFRRDDWETYWSKENPKIDEAVKNLERACPPAIRPAMVNNLLVLDHTEQRRLDVAAWQKRLEDKRKAAA